MEATLQEVLCRDVHPAELALGDRVLTDLRVFVTDRRVLAYAMRSGRIERVLELMLAEPVAASRATLPANAPLRLRVTGGAAEVDEALLNRGRGCGCGSPLKALAPPVGWTRD